MQKVIAKINLKAIEENAKAFKRLTGRRLCAVVKANAYGHGAEAVTSALSSVADMFAVALIEEGKEIRVAACGKPILVLTPPTDEAQTEAMLENGFILSVSDLRTARLVARVSVRRALPARVHLKVNTGMNRYGMNIFMLGRVCKLLKGTSVTVEGIYSHLYTHSPEESEKQRLLFVRMKRVCERYYPSVVSHLSATYGALLGEDFAFGMVRIGLGLYGYLPDEAEPEMKERVRLERAMKVYASAVQSRKYSFGGAGYGALDEETRNSLSRLTVIRAGYADGFFRKMDNGMEGAEKNASPLCMDVCIRKGRSRAGGYVPVMTDADETARAAGTISYEILCSVTERAEFVYEYR